MSRDKIERYSLCHRSPPRADFFASIPDVSGEWIKKDPEEMLVFPRHQCAQCLGTGSTAAACAHRTPSNMRCAVTPAAAWLMRVVWAMDLGRLPCHRSAAMFEHRNWMTNFGHRALRRVTVNDDDVGRIADGDAIIGQVQDPRFPSA
jgi:hypothetical protein